MKKKTAAFLAVILLMGVLFGCAAKMEYASDSALTGERPGEVGNGFYDNDFKSDMEADSPLYWTEASGAVSSAVVASDSKMIYRARIDLQTLDYETSERAVAELVSSCGGYFENRSVSNYSSNYRYGSFTIRVPREQFEHFCTQVGQMCHMTYFSSSSENITESYYDVQSRLETARIKLSRLQELLAKADNMGDIITIESAISETEYTIESLSGTLRHYDALVDYATIEISLDEVYRLSGTQAAPQSFGERIAAAFRNGLRNTVAGFEELIVGLAGAWIGILALIVVLLFAVHLVRRKGLFKKRKHSPQSEGEEKQE